MLLYGSGFESALPVVVESQFSKREVRWKRKGVGGERGGGGSYSAAGESRRRIPYIVASIMQYVFTSDNATLTPDVTCRRLA